MPCKLLNCLCDAADLAEPAECPNFIEPGSVPPTQGPGPKPQEAGSRLPPAVEAYPAADFQMAQRALNEIRMGLAFTREVVSTLPAEAEVKIDTVRMRTLMRTIVTRFENAERACMQLGLPW